MQHYRIMAADGLKEIGGYFYTLIMHRKEGLVKIEDPVWTDV